MTNFIELHLQDGSPIMYNISTISSFWPARQAAIEKYGYNCHITTVSDTNGDCSNVKETYDQIVGKINRCTSAMVVR